MENDYDLLLKTVCFGDLKHAALFFDHVIPINPLELIIQDDPVLKLSSTDSVEYRNEQFDNIKKHFSDRILNSFTRHEGICANLFFGRNDSDASERNDLTDKLTAATWSLLFEDYFQHPNLILNPGYALSHLHPVQQAAAYKRYLSNKKYINLYPAGHEVHELANTLGGMWTTIAPNKWFSETANDIGVSYQMSIKNLPVVDSSQISWQEVIDIRNDPKSRSNLRRFRSFFHKNFSGKSFSYIQDELLRSIENYRDECKSRRLAMRDGVISQLLTSTKALNLNMTAAAIFSAPSITNLPDQLKSLSLIPILTNFGGMILEYRKSNRDLQGFIDRHDLSYLIQFD